MASIGTFDLDELKHSLPGPGSRLLTDVAVG
jgi:hypothetical protein